MQRDGFAAVCGLLRAVPVWIIGRGWHEKSSALVEMVGYSVLRCKPCGHILPEPVSRRFWRGLADGEHGAKTGRWNGMAVRESKERARQGFGQS